MSVWMVLFLAAGLAADAVTVSVANGICYPRRPLRLALACGAAFGVFQGVMPLVGHFAGVAFLPVIGAYDHWIAMGLLTLIGGKMILEAVGELRGSGRGSPPPMTGATLLLQAFATSVDALAVGVGLGVLGAHILPVALAIGAVTFAGSFLGVLLGKTVGGRFSGRARLLGGCLLLLMGLHILWEHGAFF